MAEAQQSPKLISQRGSGVQVVHFRDAIIKATEVDSDEDQDGGRTPVGTRSHSRLWRVQRTNGGHSAPERDSLHMQVQPKLRMEKQKLIIILVGLPARGKTFLCNKIMCYLNW